MTTKLPQVIIFLMVLFSLVILPVTAESSIAFSDPTRQLTDLNFAAYQMQGSDTAPVFIGFVNTTNSVITHPDNASIVFLYQPSRTDYLNHPDMILPAVGAMVENYFTTLIGIAAIICILLIAFLYARRS